MSLVRQFLQDRAGNFGLAFALSAIPIMVAVGAALDYSHALTVRTQLQAAADSAAVGALAEQSVGVIESLTKGTTGRIGSAEQDAVAFFRANMDPKLASYLTAFNAEITRSGNKFNSHITFSAKVPTSFLGVVGTTAIDVAGTATASFVPATYIDFYLMLDNSPSMGLGATLADISKLEKATGCALACHTTQNASENTYGLAAQIGATTRIQLVRQAAKAMMSTAVATRKVADQYRMAVYHMGESATAIGLTNAAKMSADLTKVANQTANIELMSVPSHSFPNQQTDLLGNLTALQKLIGTSGTGFTSSDRQKVLFLVSDGVEDTPRSPGCHKKLNGTRCQQPIDYSICTKIKDSGVRIAVLYTTYYPIPSDSWYNTWIKPFQSEIGKNMRACASPDLFFEVSPSDGIEDAMNALFMKVVNLPRLTG